MLGARAYKLAINGELSNAKTKFKRETSSSVRRGKIFAIFPILNITLKCWARGIKNLQSLVNLVATCKCTQQTFHDPQITRANPAKTKLKTEQNSHDRDSLARRGKLSQFFRFWVIITLKCWARRLKILQPMVNPEANVPNKHSPNSGELAKTKSKTKLARAFAARKFAGCIPVKVTLKCWARGIKNLQSLVNLVANVPNKHSFLTRFFITRAWSYLRKQL